MTETKCPRECRAELAHIKSDIQKCEQMDDTLWEEVKLKVSQKLFFWMMGIAVAILLTTFGALYKQGSRTLEKVQAHQVDMAKVESALENHTRSTEALKGMMNEIKEENGRRR